jgi:methionyl-tRNA synthetase
MENKSQVTFDEFKKLDMRIGEIKSVEEIPYTDKLLRLEVDLGEGEHRQIISGIREFFSDPQKLVGKQCPFVTNLEPKTIRGLESNGMIMAAGGTDSVFSLLIADTPLPPGTNVC